MKIQFYKQFNKKDYWQTLEDHYYNTKQGTIKVPAYFVLDFGSLPPYTWWITHPLKYPYIKYFLLHDWLYSNKGNITRKEADLIFYNQIKEHSIIKAILFYTAVRLFGWINYKKPLPFDKNNIT